MSSELTWQLIRKHNCFITRRDGATFTSEPNNLMNKHAFKWSGLANKDAVGVDFNRDANGNVTKGCVLSTKSRKSSLRRQPAKTWNRTTFKTSDFRRVAKAIKSETQGKYYRRDLTNAALARWSQINRTA
uniref:Ribosomal eL28/Mak16 domain-containing protein n=1 Tax=Vannella robusta TaxID=1487602 RepID=A0A7S4I2J4_9EUKA|mmetsp:Transcript_19550/g.24674  ORF Transcript_19550/g.24674 Transcript_19550/m.24674 type:complete len:130 (+) Transcript_19550:61-450(+)